MLHWLKPFVQRVFTPLAQLLIRLHVTPDMVTIGATLIVIALSLWLIPTGHLIAAALLLAAFAVLDMLDGLLARMTGTAGPWGAMLDATMDRFADGAILGGLAMYFLLRPDHRFQAWGLAATLATLVFGSIVPYVRARAEAIHTTAAVGLMERGTRVAITLAAMLLAGFHWAPVWVLPVALTLIAAASFITVLQRMSTVSQQVKAGLGQAPPTVDVSNFSALGH